MKKKIKYIVLFSFSIITLYVVLFFYNGGIIEFKKNRVEADERKAHHISEEWLVDKDIRNTVAALVFYPENLSEYVFSICVNDRGPLFAYRHLHGGGGSIDEKPYLYEYKIEGIEDRVCILISRQYISGLEIDDGINVKKIEIGKNTPFVFMLNNYFDLRFYDLSGKEVEVEVVRRGLN